MCHFLCVNVLCLCVCVCPKNLIALIVFLIYWFLSVCDKNESKKLNLNFAVNFNSFLEFVSEMPLKFEIMEFDL